MNAISDVSSPSSKPLPAADRPTGWAGSFPLRRITKFAAVIGVLAVGAYAALANQAYVVTDNAVVSAYLMKMRTPINGEVTALSARMGARVPAGALIARVHRRRVDDQALLDLRQALTQAKAELTADRQQWDRLTALHVALIDRSDADLDASRARLRGLLLEAAASLRKAEAMRALAGIRLGRITRLAADGVATPAERDSKVAALAVATADVAADRGQLAALVAQAAAAAHGLLLDDGGNDVPYSAQRADEVAITLARLHRDITTTRARIAGLHAAIVAGHRRLDLLTNAVLRAPAAGTVWKLDAVAGEHVTAGESVAEVVDCANPVILAAIPDDEATRIAVGRAVRVRLAGTTTDLRGRVTGVGGARFRDQGRALAAVPAPRHTPREIVRIALEDTPPSGSACLVGRSLRVMIPARGEGVLSRWLAHLM